MSEVKVDAVLHLQDFGLERLEEEKAIVGFAQKSEAKISRLKGASADSEKMSSNRWRRTSISCR